MSLLERKTKVWKDGQTTIPYVTPELSFSKSKRFKLYSIYWPDKSQSTGVIKNVKSAIDQEAAKISKMIDDEEKNESRMTKNGFNTTKKQGNSLQDVGHPKNGFSTFRTSKTSSLSKQNQRIVQRLTMSSFSKQSNLRDRHGNRTNLLQNQQQQNVLLQKLKAPQDLKTSEKNEKGFYTANRIRLELPHNYYPGPGTYQIIRYLQQKKKQKEAESLALKKNAL